MESANNAMLGLLLAVNNSMYMIYNTYCSLDYSRPFSTFGCDIWVSSLCCAMIQTFHNAISIELHVHHVLNIAYSQIL